MKLTLVSPRLAIQKGDFLGSGIPYWPIELGASAMGAAVGEDTGLIGVELLRRGNVRMDIDDHSKLLLPGREA